MHMQGRSTHSGQLNELKTWNHGQPSYLLDGDSKDGYQIIADDSSTQARAELSLMNIITSGS